MRDAARSRGGFRGHRNTLQSIALILAQVILRAYDRAARVQSAMVARGANASKPHGTSEAPGSDEAPGSEACPNRCDITPVMAEATAPILSCTDLSFGYAGASVLENFTFEVSKGEVVVLCGPNGAGKTTLLKLFGGF